MITHTIESNWSKEDKAKVTNLNNSPKFQFETNIEMCKYEMDPTNIVEDTERLQFCPQTDRMTDGQRDKVKSVYPPFNFVEAVGITTELVFFLM